MRKYMNGFIESDDEISGTVDALNDFDPAVFRKEIVVPQDIADHAEYVRLESKEHEELQEKDDQVVHH